MSEKSLFAKFREKVRAGKIVEIVVVLILAVLVIAIVYSIIAGDPGGAAASDSETYAQSVERELSSVLSKLDGAGEVDVFVNVANEGETVIAMETKVDAEGNTTTTPVLVGGEVVVLEVRKPEITGVLIVAEGAGSIAVRSRLIDAAASALHINQSIIKVYAKEGA